MSIPFGLVLHSALGTVIDSTSDTWARASERRQMIGQVVVGGTAAPSEFAPSSLALEMVRVAGSAAKACLRRMSRHGAVRPRPVGLNHFLGYVTP